jgi:hypothetical protein
MIVLQLWELADATPGMTASHGASLGEAAAVCLESQLHQTGVSLRVEQPIETSAEIRWRALQIGAHQCHTADRATEDGACGIAILLARELTGQVVLFRSIKKEFCDYWLGPRDYDTEKGLKGMSRIEVSGIRSGTSGFWRRCEAKREQIKSLKHPSDKYISVVEFSTPMAVLEKL